MVEISKNVVSRSDVRANTNNGSRSAKTVTNSGPLKSQVDSVKLNSLDSEPVVRDMASAAPINKENVNRIKDAIRRGEYPIDLERVSDALMEAYKEMKS